MARKSKGPWFWEARNAWVVNVRGQRHYLGPDKVEAVRQWHDLEAQRPDDPKPLVEDPTTIAELLDEVLDFVKQNRSKKTYKWYQMFFQSFLDCLGDKKLKPAVEIQGVDAQNWLNERTWGPSTKRGAAIALKRAFNYGVKHDLIDKNTMAGLEKPEAVSREKRITQAQFDEILKRVPDENFQDVLKVVWLTGCRPQDVIAVEAKHHQTGRWMFERTKSQGKKVCRVVFLTDEADAITKKWAARNPLGPIFRNTKGRPWTAYAFNCRFLRLKDKIGDKVCMCSIRHSLLHQGITEGEVSPEVMAALLGHSD